MLDLLRGLNEFSSALMVLLTVCMVVLTASYVRYTGRILSASHGTLKAMEEQNWQANRGIVLVQPRFRDKYMWGLQIANAGKSPVRDLKLTFDRALISDFDERINDLPLFSEGLKYMPPGAIHNIDLWVGTGKPGTGNMLEQFEVKAEYESLGKRVSEDNPVHVRAWMGQVFPAHSAEESLEDMAKNLKEIEAFLKSYRFYLNNLFSRIAPHESYAPKGSFAFFE